jgi:autotransporter-associated beta strand protein
VGGTLPVSESTGGNGGGGGTGLGGTAAGGGGGAGGYGAVVTGSGDLGTLNDDVTGGAGGAGGSAVGSGTGGDGGSGGIGLLFTNAAGATVTIDADVAGGEGGSLGSSSGGTSGSRGPDGAGIAGQNLDITIGASGSVKAGGTTGNAISFTGGANTLSFDRSDTTTGLTGIIGVTGSLTFDQSGGDTIVGNRIEGTGSVIKSGTSKITLTAGNAFSGPLNINEGTLAVQGGTAIFLLVPVTVAAPGTFEVDTAETIGSLAGDGATVLNAGLTTGRNNSDTIYSGVISGAGGLTKEGDGTFTLSGANTFTGDVEVQDGTLELQNGAALADTVAVIVTSPGTLAVTDAETIGSLAGDGATVLNADLTTGGNGDSTTYSGVVSGAGGLTKAGTGTFTLSGANTYNGGTTVSAGTLSIGAASNIGTGTISLNGGTLLTTGSFTLANTINATAAGS